MSDDLKETKDPNMKMMQFLLLATNLKKSNGASPASNLGPKKMKKPQDVRPAGLSNFGPQPLFRSLFSERKKGLSSLIQLGLKI